MSQFIKQSRHPVTLPINANAITITSMTGQRRTQPVIRGKTIVQVNGDPQYIAPGV